MKAQGGASGDDSGKGNLVAGQFAPHRLAPKEFIRFHPRMGTTKEAYICECAQPSVAAPPARKIMNAPPISPPWHVQYRSNGRDGIEMYPTPEQAIDAACRLIDDGCDVYGIGTGPLSDSIGKAEIARIYAMWERSKLPFGERRSQARG